jgi:DNA-directed RNA polymerase subunit RPC12/RpoP
MDPEISHRCSNCGAAIRSRAQFCAQCGKQVKKDAAGSKPVVAPSEPKKAKRSEKEMKTTPLTPLKQPAEPVAEATPNANAQAALETLDGTHAVPAVWVDEKQAKKHRVKDAARGMVKENVKPRVEKLRKVSNVVLEEAAIDPSLRFVLIAALIFIVFVTVLLLSFLK